MEYEAHYEKSARMWSQGLHAHDCYEIFIHISGGRLYCVDDTTYLLKTNQLLIMPPLHMHGLICDRDLVDYERGYLYAPAETLYRCGMGEIDIAGILEHYVREESALAQIGAQDAAECIRLLRRIQESSSASQQAAESAAVAAMKNYSDMIRFLQIVLGTLSIRNNAVKPAVPDNRMQQVLHYVNENYTEDLKVTNISKRFSISESSLAHEFKAYTNRSIYEYILYRRVLKAKELLFTDRQLMEIALECGFNDYSGFLRVFKRITGMSPREYQNRMWKKG